jgi:hypothetical protein
MLDTVLSSVLVPLILIPTLKGKYHFHSCVINEKTEA